MFKKNKLCIFVLALVFAVSGSAVAPSFAKPAQKNHANKTKKVVKNHNRHQHRSMNHMSGQYGPLKLMMGATHMALKGHKDLKLTKEQKASLKKIFKESRKSLKKDNQKVRKARMKLFKATIAQKV